MKVVALEMHSVVVLYGSLSVSFCTSLWTKKQQKKLPTYEENLVVECLEERHEVEEVLQKQERMQQNELAWCMSKNIHTTTFNFIYQSALVVVPQDVGEVCKIKR